MGSPVLPEIPGSHARTEDRAVSKLAPRRERPWLEGHAYPSDEGLSVYYQDITERKRVEERLALPRLSAGERTRRGHSHG